MRHALVAFSATVALAACAPDLPDSGAGVGFGSYSDYLREHERNAMQNNAPARANPPISSERVAPGATSAITSAAPGRADTMAGIAPQSGELTGSTGGISDEQDFDAVASRESIESDRERLAQQRQQYVVIEPTALPQRSGAQGANIVEFALSTRHAPGTQMYRRSGIRIGSPERACGRYPSADLAQEAFLDRGGPDRDPMGLDPDGDGFACGWDPRPFRTALQ
ncbi:MAG: hypothetical protein WCZ72_01940 [Gemmobacter sp.]